MFEKTQEVTPIEKVLPRAWEIWKKIVSRANAVRTENLHAIWDIGDATIEDVKEFSSVGPFVSEEDSCGVPPSWTNFKVYRFEKFFHGSIATGLTKRKRKLADRLRRICCSSYGDDI